MVYNMNVKVFKDKIINIFMLINACIPSKKYKYIEDKKLIEHIIKNRKTFIRWGDGETNIVLKKDIIFQKYSSDLGNNLLKILVNYNNKNYILGVPFYYLQYSIFKYVKSGKAKVWYKTRYLMKKYLKNREVANAFIFRPLSNLDNFDIEKIWKNRSVVLVTSDYENYLKFIERYNNKVFYINILSANSYNEIDNIIFEIQKVYENNPKEDFIILISAGPTAKVIAYRLSDKNYQVIDIGQYFRWKFFNMSNNKGI